jgi:hypothetical protein
MKINVGNSDMPTTIEVVFMKVLKRAVYVVPTPRLTAVWNKCRFQNHRSLVTGFGSEKSWWGQLITREKLTAWGINLT